MKWLTFVSAGLLCLCGPTISHAQLQPTRVPDGPKAQTGIIVGTVTDVNDNTVPGATIFLEGPALKDSRTVVTKDNGFFQFNDVVPATTYHVTVAAQGFANWNSPDVMVKPGQYLILTGSKLRIADALTTIDVASSPASPEEIAAEQVKAQEQQRILGFIPNFYVNYDGNNAAPLTPKLKFKLALRVLVDPVTFIGVASFAAINQAADNPNYQEGAKGYAERFGAGYTDGAIDIMVGGAILPALLHQDPRYFYQGTGTNKSRALHALSTPFICRGDNGQLQPNYSTIGGDLASAALANAYYPESNRGARLFLGNFFIATGQRALASVAQEFLLRRITKTKNSN
jgi:hypothetical protein